ncbi:MAG: cob(I)yrinic acid a,c-diamide adenosyltransferase [Candidatus Cloacimonadales bacterium]|jgi:ATP:cob(I)alamin adenosyltransferase|nr:cob(I)yrinic acid a,c-diamide adenosyltransferase [Candidatus Cloacimonadota bacterium]MDX9977523.1 cob(I)yrinic acid a,c-diamide adenosyltransferase [Candidatus Cloacimonadales bacterium]
MSITTKGGDKGQTSLWTGERLDKDDIRVEAYGTIDELDAHLGEAKHFVKNERILEIIEHVQADLMIIMGDLASINKAVNIQEKHVDIVSNFVYEFEKSVELKGFVFPGNTLQSAKLDVCRTVARRAERRIISLHKISEINPFIIQYINRISDLCFIMARMEEKLAGEIKYK